MKITETWAPVRGHEEFYEVSDLGRIRSVARSYEAVHPRTKRLCVFNRRAVIRKTDVRPDGYESVRLLKAEAKTLLVHRIVLEAFVGKRPDGFHACHTDGDKANNSLANLRWDTVAANAADRIRHGRQARGEHHGNATLTNDKVLRIREMANHGLPIVVIAQAVGTSPSSVGRVARGIGWAHV